MPDAVPEKFVALALRLADAAGATIRPHFRTRVAVDTKSDLTPVTIADREAERAMRELIAREAPEHGVVGEEEGVENADAEWVWCLDPIDGTKAFITGKPMFGTLVSLVHRGLPVVGIIDQPVSRERWVGIAGRPSAFGESACSTRPCAQLKDAILNATSPEMFQGADTAAFARLSRSVRHTMYGGDCYAYGLLASGHIDLVVETDLKPWDWCALAPIIGGAGGRMTDWQGRELRIDSDGRVIAAGDPRLIEPTLRALGA
jgi:histidinol phosphatase-like enzyme (inositol monophosphatase family)